MNGSGDWKRAWNAVALVSALPATTVAGVLLGLGLDRVFGTGWFVTAVLGALGFAAGVYQLFRGLAQGEPPKPPSTQPDDDDPRDHPP